MKKYTILSILLVIVCITYFVVRAEANPQAAKHEIMNVNYEPRYSDRILVSNSDGKFAFVNIAKPKLDQDFTQVLMKLKEYEEQGWVLKSSTVATYSEYQGSHLSDIKYFDKYNYILER